eukprot:9154388-Pyramimonas_sp.AAC.1
MSLLTTRLITVRNARTVTRLFRRTGAVSLEVCRAPHGPCLAFPLYIASHYIKSAQRIEASVVLGSPRDGYQKCAGDRSQCSVRIATRRLSRDA